MLEAFTQGLLLITVSELGDKTFFIAAILAMRHSRRLVFVGVASALAAMTVLSVLLGQVLTFLPQEYLRWAEVLLFLGFGLKLLYTANAHWLQQCWTRWVVRSSDPSVLQSTVALPEDCESELQEAAEAVEKAESNLARNHSMGAILLEAFLLTFLAEWGDRTQIATIVLAAANHPVGVTLGAITGHSICAAIAVLSGRLIAGRLSERTLTSLGGCLFLLFGVLALLKGTNA